MLAYVYVWFVNYHKLPLQIWWSYRICMSYWHHQIRELISSVKEFFRRKFATHMTFVYTPYYGLFVDLRLWPETLNFKLELLTIRLCWELYTKFISLFFWICVDFMEFFNTCTFKFSECLIVYSVLTTLCGLLSEINLINRTSRRS